jgi:hypothetical protein
VADSLKQHVENHLPVRKTLIIDGRAWTLLKDANIDDLRQMIKAAIERQEMISIPVNEDGVETQLSLNAPNLTSFAVFEDERAKQQREYLEAYGNVAIGRSEQL